jgi:hypothetical protein
MDELELLRRFKQHVPEPDPNRVGAARAALMSRLVQGETRQRPSRRSPRPQGRWAVAAPIVAAVVLALVLPVLRFGGDAGGADPAAATALRSAADVAAHQPAGASPAAGEFVYTKTESAYLNGFGSITARQAQGWALVPVTREAWISPDGSGRILQTGGAPKFLSDQDREAWVAAGSPNLGHDINETFGPGELHFFDLSNLPTEPSDLLARIEARTIEAGPPGDWMTFSIVGDLLRETYASPGLRSALFQIAAGVPGVEFVGEVRDAIGRSGVAVAYAHAGIRHELIFDSRTSRLLGERDVLVDPTQAQLRAASGTVVGYAAYLDFGIVDSVHTGF